MEVACSKQEELKEIYYKNNLLLKMTCYNLWCLSHIKFYCINMQVQPVEWPFAESVNINGNSKNNCASYENIANYLSQKKICLMINLPLRQHRYTPAITKGYISRRMAVEYSIPLVTDIKCAKLLVKVSNLKTEVYYFLV